MSPEQMLGRSAVSQELAAELTGNSAHLRLKCFCRGSIRRRGRDENNRAVFLVLKLDSVAFAFEKVSCLFSHIRLTKKNGAVDGHAVAAYAGWT